MHSRRVALAVVVLLASIVATPATQQSAPAKLAAYKTEATATIDGMYDFAQQMVDSVFSFSELGFQEFETQRPASWKRKALRFSVA